jgi:spermidine/putrescine transport system ATP-binding protein
VHVTHDQEEAMTMADTIADMNAGLVEQMDRPTELYDSPATTFVANFLGQSNLLAGATVGTEAGDVAVDVAGQRLVVPRLRTGSTSTTTSAKVLVGIRPEKVRIARADDATGSAGDVLTGGVVTDASFTGVSTQYLVRMPWGQELTVFAQNVGTGGLLRPGTPVTLTWDPEHAFLLDGGQDATAGAAADDEAADPVAVG